jgi:hypothetical protein
LFENIQEIYHYNTVKFHKHLCERMAHLLMRIKLFLYHCYANIPVFQLLFLILKM